MDGWKGMLPKILGWKRKKWVVGGEICTIDKTFPQTDLVAMVYLL